jgi:hypothetical protein
MAHAGKKLSIRLFTSSLNLMKTVLTISCLFSLILPARMQGQFNSGFESQTVDSLSGYYAGSENSAGFEDNGLFFRNDYNASFQSWNGFALSRKTDSVTAGFSNQYSCRPGYAAGGSTFSLAYASSRIFIRKATGEPARILRKFQLANSTYAARSMQFGDAFAKKFGGISGLDPDFFALKVFNYLNGSITDSAEFFLADYRPEGTQNDYILTDWKLAETGFSQPFDSLGFELRSSDVGTFGMNTPAYFCLDNLESEAVSGIASNKKIQCRVFPNPAKDQFMLQIEQAEEFRMVDNAGRVIRKIEGKSGQQIIDLTGVPAGLYQLIAESFSLRLLVE